MISTMIECGRFADDKRTQPQVQMGWAEICASFQDQLSHGQRHEIP